MLHGLLWHVDYGICNYVLPASLDRPWNRLGRLLCDQSVKHVGVYAKLIYIRFKPNVQQGHTRTDRAAMEDLLIIKNLPVDWTPHEDVTKSRFSTLNCLLVTEGEGALVSGSRIPSREPEAERQKDRLMDITLTAGG